MVTVASDLAEVSGLHQTGAAQYAVLLSENSRIDVTPYSDGETHVAFIRYGNRNINGRKRGQMLALGSVALNYGYYDTVIGRSGTTLRISVQDFGEYLIENLDPDVTVPIVGFDVMSETIKPVVFNLTVDGEFCNMKTGGTVINNMLNDRVVVKFIARVPFAGSEYILDRNDETTILGMTYSDARSHMIDERKRVLGEEGSLAFAEVKRQTQLQIPSRHDRDNTGKSISAIADNKADGSGPTNAADFLYRLIDTPVIAINNIDQPEYDIYLKDNLVEKITDFKDLRDVWGLKMGPMEASRANIVYVALKSDGNYVPPNLFERTIQNKIREKINELNDNLIAETYLLAMQKIEDAHGGTFIEKLVNMNVEEAAYFGAPSTNYIMQTVDFLRLAQMQNLTIEFETSFALGSVLAYGRRGVAQMFVNSFNGINTTAPSEALRKVYNEFLDGTSISSAVDNTTGYFLFDSDAPKDVVPIGMQILAADEGDPVLTLSNGYSKSYGDQDQYRCRPCVVNFRWNIDLSKILLTDIRDRDEETVIANYLRIHSYIVNAMELVVANINWYIMHISLAGWDNMAVPLSSTFITEYRQPNTVANSFELMKYTDFREQFVENGITDREGDMFYEAKFPANGDRITFGVPNIDRMIDISLEPRRGYRVQKIPNVKRPFIVIDEDNFLTSIDTGVSTNLPATVMRNSIMANEFVVKQTDGGYDFKEPKTDKFFINTQDRNQTVLPYGASFPGGLDASGVVETLENLVKKVGSLEERQARIPHTFTGTVIGIFGNIINVKPDDRKIIIKATKISGENIGLDDRVLGLETAPGKFGVFRLPLRSIVSEGSAEENTWFQAGGE